MTHPPFEPDVTALRARLAELREQRGLTYEQLAERSGLGRRSVIALETGERDGSLASWYRVARGLGVPVSELLDVLG